MEGGGACLVEGIGHQLHHLGGDHSRLPIVRHTELGGKPQGLEVGADDLQAIGMDGGDVGTRQLVGLTAVVLVIGFGKGKLGDLLVQLTLQIPCGCLGKGHHQKIPDGIPVFDPLQDAVGEDGGLTAPRSCGDQQIGAPNFQGLLLGRCPLRTHIPFLLPR